MRTKTSQVACRGGCSEANCTVSSAPIQHEWQRSPVLKGRQPQLLWLWHPGTESPARVRGLPSSGDAHIWTCGSDRQRVHETRTPPSSTAGECGIDHERTRPPVYIRDASMPSTGRSAVATPWCAARLWLSGDTFTAS